MTPQERQQVDELFTRLAALEQAPRDAQAVAAINDGLERAPNALYALVQTVLVQDEALKQTQARLAALEGTDGAPAQGGSFLDTMRDAVFGRSAPARGSVPSVPPGAPSVWNQSTPQAQQPQQGGGLFGGSFLGTAAATAAGVIGGSILASSLRSMFDHGSSRSSLFEGDANRDAPWQNDGGGGNLAREAGLDDIGRSDSQRNSLFGGSDAGQQSFDSASFDDGGCFDLGDTDFG